MPSGEWVTMLSGLDVRTRAVYQAYLRERERGPRVEATPGCKLYDVVQQRTRAYLSESRGCCEPPAVEQAPESGRCLTGKRLLVGIPSYGDNPRTWALLSIVLQSLDHTRRTGGVQVEVGLDLTHAPPPGLHMPEGLPVSVWRHSTSVKNALAGLYRQRFWVASAERRHDYYMMIDNDVNVTRESLEALCVHSHRLAGTNLMPGLLRYETLSDEPQATRYLLDHMLRSPPHISSVVRHGGVRYVAPHNPMQGSFFLPAARLACVMRKIERRGGYGSDWRSFHHNGSLEYYESLWLLPWLITVVPLRSAPRHMVHHLTDKYIRTTEVTMVKPDAFLRAASNFSGRPMTLLGARRRRPSKKLEVELRERDGRTGYG